MLLRKIIGLTPRCADAETADDYASLFSPTTDLSASTIHGSVQTHAARQRYGILARSDMKGRGIGRLLMSIMIQYAKSMGLNRIDGRVLYENRNLLEMCRHLGFTLITDPEDPGLIHVSLDVQKTEHG